MTKLTRRLLFYASLFIFALIGGVLIVFAMGYEFDFVSYNFVKTGSFQLKTNVNADVYLNDKLIGKTSFFSNSFTKNGLLPRTYDVKIQNPSYQIWTKNVDINVGLVTDFPKILLIPKKIDTLVVASSSFSNLTSISFDSTGDVVKVFSLNRSETIRLDDGLKVSITPSPSISPKNDLKSLIKPYISPSSFIGPTNQEIIPNAKKVISPNGEKEIWYNNHEIWIEWLKDSSYQPYMSAGEVDFVIRYSENIKNVLWHDDSSHLIINVGNLLKIIETDTRGGINSYDLASIDSPYIYTSNNKIYYFQGNKLIRLLLD
jgi:hypothetical protein